MWTEIRDTFAAEFSDVAGPRGFALVCIRLLVAGGCGAIVGYQREHHGKSAGLRTHVLVALGAAVYAMTPQLAGATPDAMARVVQGIVVGIGFLGAGAISRGDKPGEVNGLTTSAGIWTTAAIGMTAGFGREMTAVISSFVVLAVLSFVPHTKRAHGPIVIPAPTPKPPTPKPEKLL